MFTYVKYHLALGLQRNWIPLLHALVEKALGHVGKRIAWDVDMSWSEMVLCAEMRRRTTF